MSAGSPVLPRIAARVPTLPWWILLGITLLLFLKVHWIAAVAVLALALVQRARPLDFLTSYLMVVALASFMNYGSGQLTYQMWILTAFLTFMLMCYVLSRRRDALVFPSTPALRPLLLYLGLTGINFVRGLAIGNSARYAGLELIAALALGTCILIASRKPTEGELKAALLWLWIVALGHCALGFYVFSIIHVRTGGIYFHTIPGVVAVVMFNFALREPHRPNRLLWLLAIAPLLLHQFLSFTRGYWFGIIAAILFSVAVYGGRGEGSRARWKRSGVMVGAFVGLGILGVVVLSTVFGIGQIWELAGNRFASSSGTKYTWESSSNVVRLVEYAHVLEDIIEKPIFGHGLGYYFVVREPIGFTLIEQWFCHENYLLVWLKQGIIGLGLWLWLLVSLMRTCLRGRSLPSPIQQAWCTGAGAFLVYVMVFGLVHFPLAEVNTTFAFALMAGGAMSLTADHSVALRWKSRREPAERT